MIIQSDCPWSACTKATTDTNWSIKPNLSRDDSRRFDFHSRPLAVGGEGAFAVDGVAEGVDDSPEQLVADGDVDDGARPLHDVAFFDQLVVAEDHDADVVCGRKGGRDLRVRCISSGLLLLFVVFAVVVTVVARFCCCVFLLHVVACC